MDEKVLVELLKGISDIHRSQFDERRRYEWRVLLSTLGFYVGTIGAKLASKITLPSSTLFFVIISVSFIGLGIISSFYLSFIHRANKVNKRFAQAAENVLMDKSEVTEFKNIINSLSVSGSDHWSLYWQVTSIFLFAVVSLLIIFFSITPCK